MKKSLFVAFIAAFTQIAASIEKRINDKKTEQTYLFKDSLIKKQSTDLRWDSLTVNGTLVAADVVALSSKLPLKKRDKFSTASGEIPKLGMKMQMNEKAMSDVEILKSRGVAQAELVKLIFEDEVKCTMGIYEKLELMFLQGLSSGIALVDDDTNVGTGIRVNYGYLADNRFGVAVDWTDSTAKPIDDIKRIIRQAQMKGDVPKYMWLDSETLDALCNNTQVKEQFAFTLGYTGGNIPAVDNEQIKTLFSNRLKLSIIEVDRYVMVERDGKQTPTKCWADNQVIFTTSNKVGDLVWGTLVEDLNRSKDVDYAKVDGFILLKKWHEPEPFAEFTSSQALVLPVINNVSSIYIIDTTEAESTAGQTEDDATITIYGDSTVTVANLVNALNHADVKSKPVATTEMTDVQLIALVNKLSDAKETILKEILEIPVVSAGADTTSSAATKALLGTATAAGDKEIETILWSQVSGPNTAGFSAPTALSTNATGLITGTYVFKLTVTDSEGTIASDTVSVVATVA